MTTLTPDAPSALNEAGSAQGALNRLSALASEIVEPGSSSPSNLILGVHRDLHAPLMTVISGSIDELARTKNVAITPKTLGPLAHAAIERLSPAVLSDLLRGDQAAIIHAAVQINRVLDLIAGMQFLIGLWRVEGFYEQLDSAPFTSLAQDWLSQRGANDVLTTGCVGRASSK